MRPLTPPHRFLTDLRRSTHTTVLFAIILVRVLRLPCFDSPLTGAYLGLRLHRLCYEPKDRQPHADVRAAYHGSGRRTRSGERTRLVHHYALEEWAHIRSD